MQTQNTAAFDPGQSLRSVERHVLKEEISPKSPCREEMKAGFRLDVAVQIVTSVAVLIGLALVVWELQQNREATTSQLTSDGLAFISALNTAVMGEQTADVLAKACEHPNELATADYYVLDNYYAEILDRYRRIALLQQRGSFYADASFDAGMGIGYLFDSAPGRAYLKSIGVEDPLIARELNAKIQAWDGVTCTEYFGAWKEVVQRELDQKTE